MFNSGINSGHERAALFLSSIRGEELRIKLMMITLRVMNDHSDKDSHKKVVKSLIDSFSDHYKIREYESIMDDYEKAQLRGASIFWMGFTAVLFILNLVQLFY